MPPELVDQRGEGDVVRRYACELLGIFKRACEIAGITAKRHQCLQGVAVDKVTGRQP